MFFLKKPFLGRRAMLGFATTSPEMDVSSDLPRTTVKLNGLEGQQRPLRKFLYRHRLLVRALVLTLVWEVVAECVGLLAVLIFPPSTDLPAFFQNHPAFHQGYYPLWETIWARWDGIWYTLIAAQGYGPYAGLLPAFFPAFPGMIHIFCGLFGGNYLLAGVLINRLLLFPTVALFTQLVREEFGERAAESAPLFLLLLPVAVFFLAVYSETLFVLACLACFLAMRHQRWLLAGLCCALATATRLPGIVLAGAVLVEGLASRKYWQGLGAAALGMAGLAAYALYLHLVYHDALAFQHAYAYGWGDRQFTLNIWWGPQVYFQSLLTDRPWNRGDVTYLGCVVALVISCALLALMWRSLRWSYRVFVLGSMLLPLLSGTLFAYNRYSLTLFPFVLVACRWTAYRPTLREATLLVMGFFCVLGIVMFTSSYWVG
jgi:Gpi18-like mannosyltransferase